MRSEQATIKSAVAWDAARACGHTWMYSPLVIQRCVSPSHFCMAVNTTVLAGMFRPIANVSVANSACATTQLHIYMKYANTAMVRLARILR